MNRHLPLCVLGLLLLTTLFSCVDTAPVREGRFIDSLNDMAYAWRYKNLDSSYRMARKAYDKVGVFYQQGKAEAILPIVMVMEQPFHPLFIFFSHHVIFFLFRLLS